MNSDQIKAFQTLLNQKGYNIPVTGVLDSATTQAMNSSVASALSAIPSFSSLSGGASASDLASAYTSGDYSGITSLTGKPFTDAQQSAAFGQATDALAPGFNESKAYDTSNAENSITQQNEGYNDYLANEATNFKSDKVAGDQSASDNGILFSGARTQKEKDLKTLYENRDAQQRETAANNIANTTQDYQYKYGNAAAPTLSSYYNGLSGGNTYNAGVAGGAVTPKTSIASIYNPAAYNYQGTAVNANNANVQTRAAALLANNANKLTPTGYKTQY